MIGRLKLPTLVVQEGGYRTRSLGANARQFFAGLWEGARADGATSPVAPPKKDKNANRT
jgi:acetoin utilization deacetylase AcuC-like enzyme